MAVSQKKLYSTGAKPISTETLDSIELQLNRAIETVWLTAAFLVPLLVLSEHDFTSFTELPKITLVRSLAGFGFILWLMTIAVGAVKNADTEAPASQPVRFSVKRWISARPIDAAAVLVLLVTGISTLLSIQPNVSALGAEWGRDGYDLHTTAAYITIFFLAATRIRSRGQIVRLWFALSVTGFIAALIGIAQHFAMAPFGISGTYQHQRVTGTVGNPLFLGSLLTLTMPIGVSLAFAAATGKLWQAGPRSPSWLAHRNVALASWFVIALIVFVHVYAALFTASRGPWIGMSAGLFVLVLLAFMSQGLKNAALMTAAVAAGGLFAISLALGPMSSGIESFAVSEQQELFDEKAEAGVDAPSVAPASTSFVIGQRGKQGTIENRLNIWRAVREVSAERPTLPESNNAPWIVRQTFGYGPDTFRFVFPTKAPEEMMGTLTSTAHNDPLNRLVELGIAGLLAYGALLFSVLFVVWRFLSRRVGENGALFSVFAVGAGAAIAGRLVEQIPGVPEVSDTTVLWLLFAMLAATYPMTCRGSHKPALDAGQSSKKNRSAAIAEPDEPQGWTLPAIPPALAFSFVAIGIIVAGYLIWSHNINLLRSDMEFKKGEVALFTDVDQALLHMERAADLNPGVENYQHARAEVLNARAELTVDSSERLALLREAYQAERDAYNFNPTSRAANFELAFASWQLAQLGDADKAFETVGTYERLLELAPAHPLVTSRLEQLRLAVGIE